MLPLLLLIAAASARPRDTWPGDWRPTDPKAIAKVCRSYDRVEGELIIGPDYTAEDLRPLSCLVGVGRGLRIEGAPALRSLAGAEALRPPTGVPFVRLRIEGNPALVQVDALNAIPGLQVQTLHIKNNPALRHVQLGAELVSGGEVLITGNRALQRVDGPPGLATGARLRAVEVSANPDLVALTGFGRVIAVDRLTVAGNAALAELRLLPDLRSGADLLLRGLPALRDFAFAPALEQAERLGVADLDALERLPAWPNLTQVGTLVISDNAALQRMDGVWSNRSGPPVVDRLIIEDNPALRPEATEGLARRLRTRPDAARLERNGGG